MKKWFYFILTGLWSWFKSQKSLSEISRNVKDKLKKPFDKKSYEWYRGKLIWDSRYGTYRRRSPKIGRNAPCPCGTMRQAPRDIQLRNKYKWCCRSK